MNKTLYCIMGKSGSGKSHLVQQIKKVHGLKSIKSYTTRPQRNSKDNDHIFITEEEYDALDNKIATTTFNGYHYCATEEQLDNADIYIIDPDGLKTLKTNRPKIVIYLYGEDEVLEKQMQKRGDSYKDIKERLEHDAQAFKEAEDFADYIIEVGNNAYDMVEDIIEEQKRNAN